MVRSLSGGSDNEELSKRDTGSSEISRAFECSQRDWCGRHRWTRNWCSGCIQRLSPKAVSLLLPSTISKSMALNMTIMALDRLLVLLCTRVAEKKAKIGENHYEEARAQRLHGLESPGSHG